MRFVRAFRISLMIVCAALALGIAASALAPEGGNWFYWRGPAADGMAVGDAPLHWGDNP